MAALFFFILASNQFDDARSTGTLCLAVPMELHSFDSQSCNHMLLWWVADTYIICHERFQSMTKCANLISWQILIVVFVHAFGRVVM